MGLTTALMVAGTGLGVIGDLSKGSADAEYMRQQAENARYQAQVAENNAAIAAGLGESRLEQRQMKTAADIGIMTATQGASGVDVSKGSAPQVRAATRSIGMMDALTIRNDAAREAYGFKTQATVYNKQAENFESGASNAETAGWINSLGTLVGGATNISNKGGFGPTWGM